MIIVDTKYTLQRVIKEYENTQLRIKEAMSISNAHYMAFQVSIDNGQCPLLSLPSILVF